MHFHGRVVGLLGKSKSGKDTVANIVKKNRGRVASIAFADKLKEICKDVFAFSDEQLYGSLKEVSDTRYPTTYEQHGVISESRCTRCGQAFKDLKGPCVTYLTPRRAMQLLGTEWGRACYPPVWVEYTFRKANELFAGARVTSKPFDAGSGTSGKGSYIINKTDLIFITDVRFSNEVLAIREAGGEVWKVVRPRVDGLTGAAAAHASEAEIDAPENEQYLDAVVTNDSTLEELEERVMVALG